MCSFVVRALEGGKGFLPCFALSHSFTVLYSIWWCSAPATCPERAALGDLAAWPGPSGHFSLVLLMWTQHSPELALTSAPHSLCISILQPQHACALEVVSHDFPGVVIARPRLTFTLAPQPPLCTYPLPWLTCDLWGWVKNCEGLHFYLLQTNQWACSCFPDAGRRHEVPGSELTHRRTGSQSSMLALVPLAHGCGTDGPGWGRAHAGHVSQEGMLSWRCRCFPIKWWTHRLSSFLKVAPCNSPEPG